jgi:pimeloyl-ACP methyl ester carboxylesterase
MLKMILKVIAITCLILTQLFVSMQAQTRTSDLAIDVRVVGEDDANNVILIPGLSSPGEVWNSTVKAMGEKFRFHIVSLPGFAGKPPVETEQPFIEAMADEIVNYIAENSIEQPVLAGHSLGGFLSLYIGVNYPDLPAKIVSVDGVPFLPAMVNPYINEESAQSMAENMSTQMLSATREQRLAQQQQVIQTMVTNPEKQKIAVDWSMSSDIETVASSVYYLYSTDLRDELSAIEVPVLVFGAWKAYEAYGVTSEMSRQMYSNQYSEVNQLTLKISDTGRHFLMWDDPGLITNGMTDFLSE